MIAAAAHFLAQQQFAGGMIGAAVVGSLLFSLKQLPVHLWRWLIDQAFVNLAVEGTDPAYEQLGVWFAKRRMSDRARRLMLSHQFDYAAQKWSWAPTLGEGWHLRWFRARPLLIHREVEKGGELSKLIGKSGANQRLRIYTLGRSQAPMLALIDELERIYNSDGLVRVFYWADGCYRLADHRKPRPMETVFLPEAQKARLTHDLQRFIGAREAYAKRGTPFRRGYLFEGPPGTGKTSLIFALAGLIDRDVYAINLANVTSDNGLMAAFNEAPSRGVVVIEDIDAADVTRDRQQVEEERRASPFGGTALRSTGSLTLSGLLNAIDGLAARESRVMFVTTNAPEKLDPALLRAGRIDVRERVDLLGRAPAFAMYQACALRPTLEEFERLVAPHLPMSGASLQGLLQDLAHAPLTLVAEDGRRLA